MSVAQSNGINLYYATIPTPIVSEWWRKLDDVDRDRWVRGVIGFWPVRCLSAKPNGVVTLELFTDLSAGDRGEMLRAIEAALKDEVDDGLEVYLQAAVDKNALRKLRGVQIVER